MPPAEAAPAGPLDIDGIVASVEVASLSQAQAAAGEDGWVECVVSPEHPGVASWLDTGGLRTVPLPAHWQALPAGGADPPALPAEVMSRRAFAARRPACGGPADPAERSRRHRERTDAWNRRFT